MNRGLVIGGLAAGLCAGVVGYAYVTRFAPSVAGTAAVVDPVGIAALAGAPDTGEGQASRVSPAPAADTLPGDAADGLESSATASIASASIASAATAPRDEAANAAADGDADRANPAVSPVPRATAAPTVYFRYVGTDANYGRLAKLELGPAGKPSFHADLQCEVVHVTGPRGVCLAADRGVLTTYAARIFDAGTQAVLADVPLSGIPSRTRVSRGGRYAATTVFVTGHGYATVDFSTQTLIVDLESNTVAADLDHFTVTWDGEPRHAEDYNFWGVTFVGEGGGFYATLSTAREHHLVRGDLATRTMAVLKTGVECPSASPDGRRIAFKRRQVVDGTVAWQIMSMDVATGRETALADQRNIDDQLEWLDDDVVLYAVPTGPGGGASSSDVWMVRADGSGSPVRLITNAYSPAVVR